MAMTYIPEVVVDGIGEIKAVEIPQVQTIEEQVLRIAREIDEAREQDTPVTWERLYRHYSKHLRRLSKDSPMALRLLQELSLEQTLPFNELENPYWIDSYTGEEISDDDPNEQFDGEVAPLDNLGPSWNGQLMEMVEYAAKQNGWTWDEMQAAYDASAEYVGDAGIDDDSEPDWFDDRLTDDDLPVYLLPEHQIDHTVWSDAKQALDHYWFWRSDTMNAVNRLGIERYEDRVAEFQKQHLAQPATREMITRLRTLIAVDGYDPASVAAVFFRVQHDDWGIPMSEAKNVRVPIYGTLYRWIEYFGDDVLDALTNGGPGLRMDEPSSAEISQVADHYLEQIFEMFETDTENPVHDLYWAKPYILSVMNGATLEQARAQAWAEWKTRPKFIVEVKDNGLVISGKRQINLGLAHHLATLGELKVKADAPFELKQAIFTKLRNAWPMSLLSQLRQDS
jgi:hypothetical protein